MNSKCFLQLLIAIFFFGCAVSQQCNVVIASLGDLQDLKSASCSNVCNRSLEAKLDDKLDEMLATIVNRIEQSQQNHTRALLNRLHPAASCAEILRNDPTSPSGYYWIDDQHSCFQPEMDLSWLGSTESFP